MDAAFLKCCWFDEIFCVKICQVSPGIKLLVSSLESLEPFTMFKAVWICSVRLYLGNVFHRCLGFQEEQDEMNV